MRFRKATEDPKSRGHHSSWYANHSAGLPLGLLLLAAHVLTITASHGGALGRHPLLQGTLCPSLMWPYYPERSCLLGAWGFGVLGFEGKRWTRGIAFCLGASMGISGKGKAAGQVNRSTLGSAQMATWDGGGQLAGTNVGAARATNSHGLADHGMTWMAFLFGPPPPSASAPSRH